MFRLASMLVTHRFGHVNVDLSLTSIFTLHDWFTCCKKNRSKLQFSDVPWERKKKSRKERWIFICVGQDYHTIFSEVNQCETMRARVNLPQECVNILVMRFFVVTAQDLLHWFTGGREGQKWRRVQANQTTRNQESWFDMTNLALLVVHQEYFDLNRRGRERERERERERTVNQ